MLRAATAATAFLSGTGPLAVRAISRFPSLHWIAGWGIVVGCALAVGWLTGRLVPQTVPDTASYLRFSFAPLNEMLRAERTPGYPLWLLFWRQTFGLRFVPAAQIVVHATAAWMVWRELRRWELPPPERLAAMLAIGLGCTPMDHIHILSTDALAASLGVMTATLAMRWARENGSAAVAVAMALVAVVAIFVRPAYLFLVPWIFLAGMLLCVRRGSPWRGAATRAMLPVGLAATAIIAWMLLRLIVIGDFGIASFGHQNLSGVLVQLVSDEELQSLEGDAGRLAAAIAERKSHLVETGHRFAEGDAGATMTLESRWDDMTYLVVIPAAASIAGDDPVAKHRLIGAMNREIVRVWPLRYGGWLVKAARRAAWGIAADIVMHPIFLAAGALALLVVLHRVLDRRPRPPVADWPVGLDALAVVAVTYTAAHVGFVILSSPPIGRFSDAAAIFVPAWLAAAFLHSQLRRVPAR